MLMGRRVLLGTHLQHTEADQCLRGVQYPWDLHRRIAIKPEVDFQGPAHTADPSAWHAILIQSQAFPSQTSKVLVSHQKA